MSVESFLSSPVNSLTRSPASTQDRRVRARSPSRSRRSLVAVATPRRIGASHAGLTVVQSCAGYVARDIDGRRLAGCWSIALQRLLDVHRQKQISRQAPSRQAPSFSECSSLPRSSHIAPESKHLRQGARLQESPEDLSTS